MTAVSNKTIPFHMDSSANLRVDQVDPGLVPFFPFESFNAMQSVVFESLWSGSQNLVISVLRVFFTLIFLFSGVILFILFRWSRKSQF